MAHELINRQTAEQVALIAARAGEAIMEIYGQARQSEVSTKHDQSPLTLADLRANEVIVSALTNKWPQIPILSEESDWVEGFAKAYWAVDPLDGTKEFLAGIGEFTINIALVVNGRASLGAICAPASGELWIGACLEPPIGQWAYRASGVHSHRSPSKTDQAHVVSESIVWSPISVSQQPPGSHESMRLVGSRSHAGGDMPGWLKRILAPGELTVAGSSLKFCLIAQGDADIYVRMGPTSIWDTAAGQAILQGAGGAVVCIEQGSELIYEDPRRTLNKSFIAYAPQRINLLRPD